MLQPIPTPVANANTSQRASDGVGLRKNRSPSTAPANNNGPPMSSGRKPRRLAARPANPATTATVSGARHDAKPARRTE